MSVKLYHGPRKSRSESLVLVPPVIVKQIDEMVYLSGATNLRQYDGILPGTVSSFMSLYVPKFKKLVSEGWIIQNPFLKTREAWGCTPGTFTDTRSDGSPATWGYTERWFNVVDGLHVPHLFPATPSYADSLQRARDEALTRVFSKANAAKFDGLIELTQLRGTLKMFLGLLKRLYVLAKTPGAFLDIIRAIEVNSSRRVRIPGHRDKVPVTDLAGLWCELRFGWRPLLASLEGLIDVIQNSGSRPKRVTYRAREDFSFEQTTRNTVNSSVLPPGVAPMYFDTTVKYTASLRAGILLEPNYSLQNELGLELAQVPIAAWDLVPYSFIVDRFVNVGNYIRSLIPIPSSIFGGAWLVERGQLHVEWRGERTAISYTTGSGATQKRWTRSPMVNKLEMEKTFHKRSIHPWPPELPVLRWDWSTFYDLFNAIDALFLAIQRIKR